MAVDSSPRLRNTAVLDSWRVLQSLWESSPQLMRWQRRRLLGVEFLFLLSFLPWTTEPNMLQYFPGLDSTGPVTQNALSMRRGLASHIKVHGQKPEKLFQLKEQGPPCFCCCYYLPHWSDQTSQRKRCLSYFLRRVLPPGHVIIPPAPCFISHFLL